MIIHFIGSKGNITQEIDYYQAIVDSIKQYGHTLAQDWVDVVYKAATKSNEWDKDLVIVESTKRSFFVGYGVAQAVHQKKPVLILVRDDSFPGIKYLSDASDIIYGAQYDLKTLDSVIGKFLEENTIETKDMRFNFFIDRAIYNYLRWAAFKTGKTKAEVLRELVQREIEKKDY
jgi:hypothetical protein